jgi:hypothetical protein
VKRRLLIAGVILGLLLLAALGAIIDTGGK